MVSDPHPLISNPHRDGVTAQFTIMDDAMNFYYAGVPPVDEKALDRLRYWMILMDDNDFFDESGCHFRERPPVDGEREGLGLSPAACVHVTRLNEKAHFRKFVDTATPPDAGLPLAVKTMGRMLIRDCPEKADGILALPPASRQPVWAFRQRFRLIFGPLRLKEVSVRVRCAGNYHTIKLTRDGRLVLCNHPRSGDDRNRTMASMDRSLFTCFSVRDAWRDAFLMPWRNPNDPDLPKKLHDHCDFLLVRRLWKKDIRRRQVETHDYWPSRYWDVAEL